MDKDELENMKCINSIEVDEFLWEHAQIQGHQCDGVKDEFGINVMWVDSVTGESVTIKRNPTGE